MPAALVLLGLGGGLGCPKKADFGRLAAGDSAGAAKPAAKAASAAAGSAPKRAKLASDAAPSPCARKGTTGRVARGWPL